MYTPIEDELVNMPNTIYGLNIAWASNTTFTVAPGYTRDSTNTYEIILPSSVTVNQAVVGKNGLDTGTVAASTVYYVHVIGDSTNKNLPYVAISLSATAPTFVSGYDMFRRIGVVVTVASTAYFSKIYQAGNGLYRWYTYDTPISVLSGGTQTSLTAVSLGAVVPAIGNMMVKISYSFVPNAADDTAVIGINGTGTGITIYGNVAAKHTSGIADVMSALVTSVPNIYYSVTASGSLNASVAGFVDCL